MAVLNLNKSVYSLCTKNPQLIPLLAELGFTDIVTPGMLQSVGRYMTIPKGAVLKKISMPGIVQKLTASGFSIKDEK